MSGYLYYLPKTATPLVIEELVISRGLEMPFRDLLRDWKPGSNVVVAGVNRGPDASAGVVLCPNPPDGKRPRDFGVGYFADRQAWTEQPGGWWLGVDTQHPPTPAGLARPHQVKGYSLPLGDGRVWECPVLRRVMRPLLPCRWGVNDAGELQRTVLDEYAWAWELAETCWQIFLGRGHTDEQVWDIACQLLSINYRIGPREITQLGLLTDDTVTMVFRAAVDGDLLETVLEQAHEEAPITEKKTSD